MVQSKLPYMGACMWDSRPRAAPRWPTRCWICNYRNTEISKSLTRDGTVQHEVTRTRWCHHSLKDDDRDITHATATPHRAGRHLRPACGRDDRPPASRNTYLRCPRRPESSSEARLEQQCPESDQPRVNRIKPPTTQTCLTCPFTPIKPRNRDPGLAATESRTPRRNHPHR